MAGAFSAEAAKNMPTDFSSVESLPDSHTWWPNGCSDIIDGSVSIPEVDPKDPTAVEAIRLACEEWGVFQLKNHGIPLSLLSDVDDEVKRLFSFPVEQKLKALRRPGTITGYGTAYISSYYPKSMWHEGFTILGSSYNDVKKVLPEHDHANFWYDDVKKVLPEHDHENCCEKVEQVQMKMNELANDLTERIVDLSGTCEEKELDGMMSKTPHVLQMNSYPPCPDPNRAMGFAPHKDTSIITLVRPVPVQMETLNSGLQVFKEGTGWVPVSADSDDALLVLVGDILHILSNTKFLSVLHRVAVSNLFQRYSYAYFHTPPPEFLLAPRGSVPRFRRVLMKEYVDKKAKDPINALSSISI